MNFSESILYVLKNRRGELFRNFWKRDLRKIFRDVKKDVAETVKSGAEKIQELKTQSFKETLGDLKDSTVDSVTLFKEVPNRIRQGLIYFQQDLTDELDALPEEKQKALFGIKVIGVLSSSTLSAFYGAKKTKGDLQFRGLKLRSAMAQMVATELLVRISRSFTLRLIEEIENQIDDPAEKKKLDFFKKLLTDGAVSEEEAALASEIEESDRAFAIVNNLKTFILTGKRV